MILDKSKEKKNALKLLLNCLSLHNFLQTHSSL